MLIVSPLMDTGIRKSWDDIRRDATRFAKDWRLAYDEKSQAQSFLVAFFNVFGVETRQVATFEHRVKLLDGSQGFIDLLWKGCILVEMKSKGKDLAKALEQARAYVETLPPHEIPRAIVVSDFQNFHVHDLVRGGECTRFKLADLRKYVKLFGMFLGLDAEPVHEQNPVNRKAAERMAALHDALQAIGYAGHPLEVYLVRLLFCLFAEDSEIFERGQFTRFVREHTADDGSDLATRLAGFFEVLDTPPAQRLSILDPVVGAFPYVNGGLFHERLPVAAFSREMRESLLKCTELDWSEISPAIFGAMFQGVMDPAERRALGAHYTSEENILKLLRPLFLDDLQEELEETIALRGPGRKRALNAFHDKLASLTFLDPACGCGNFLIIAYRELRRLELRLLRALREDDPSQVLDVVLLLRVAVDQFAGIEIEPFPAEISRVSLWLIDHLCNREASLEFGQNYARIPIRDTPRILCANALATDWRTLAPDAPTTNPFSYILGNPPFVGHQWRDEKQAADMALAFHDLPTHGKLDFVCAWYNKAADLIQQSSARAAFVSTNSIVEGESVGILWPFLFERKKMQIDFAYRSFVWSNEAKGVAAVHCVIIGFSARRDIGQQSGRGARKVIFDEDGTPQPAKNINGYLLDAPNVFIRNRGAPLAIELTKMSKGSQPTDGGNFMFSAEERDALVAEYPTCAKLLRRYISADDYINNRIRFCLWLKDVPPQEYRNVPPIMQRLAAVAEMRRGSPTGSVRRDADTPMLFTQIRQPQTDYLVVPEVSSKRRKYIPIGFLSSDVVASNKLYIICDANCYMFGILTSSMHMAWMRIVAGRLKSDYSYSPAVYNNFIWPEVDEARKAAVAATAQGVLDARAKYPESTLADLYDPLTMPPELTKAHAKLDALVDKLYGRAFATDADRVSHLFSLYAASAKQI